MRFAENDLDNRISAGHAAFFNSFAYTRFGYTSLVFVREQGVPFEIEIDDADPSSDHALASVAGVGVVGTGRLLPDGHIGRMAVLQSWRGKGVGAALLDTLTELARLHGHKCVRLNAQTAAAGFYRRAGFEVCGPEFMEVDIPHVAMQRLLAD